MRKDLILAAAVMLSAFALPSCSIDDDDEIPSATNSKTEQLAFTASATMECGDKGLSKAALQSNMKIYFSANEEAYVKFLDASGNLIESATFTGDNTSEAATTNFKGSIAATTLNDAESIIATFPASAVDTDGKIVIPTEQTPVAGSFDPKAFIATGTVNKSTMKATFNSDVVLLRITAASAGDITINATGIAGKDGSADQITVKGLTAGNAYYVAITPKTYSAGITIKSGDDVLKTLSPATLQKGYFYSALLDISLTLSDLDIFTNIDYTKATKIVFDYTKNVANPGNFVTSIKDGAVNIYNNGTVYYILSDNNICMTGTLDMFYSGTQKKFSSLKAVEFNNFNTAAVTDMDFMFVYCSSLESLDLSGFNTEKVVNMTYMFTDCSSLTSLDLSDFNTEEVTTMMYMFSGCSSLTSLDLSDFNTEKVFNMGYMFYNCSNLEHIYVGTGWNTNGVTYSLKMFTSCKKLPNFGSGTDASCAHTGKGGYLETKAN